MTCFDHLSAHRSLYLLLTRGASGVFWEICLCMCVSLDRQNPHLAFKTLQNQNMWASYDMLEKTIIQSFAEKLQSREKACKSLHYTRYSVYHGESPLGKASKSSLHVMRRYLKASHICAIAQCHKASLHTCAHTTAHNHYIHNSVPPDPSISKTWPQLGQTSFLTLALQLQLGQLNL